MIDTHIHLDAQRYRDVEGLCERSRERGVEAIIVPGIGASSNAAVLQLGMRFAQFVYPAVGLHPELPSLARDDIDAMAATVRDNRKSICAVGEVGLPYYGPSAAAPERRGLARDVVECAAALARELDLALILHAPHQTAATALQIVQHAGAGRVVFHWHKVDEPTTRAIFRAGFLVALTPDVVWRQRDRELVRLAPLDQIVVETDGPYSHERVFPGAVTEPWMVSNAIAGIAEIKGLDREEVEGVTSANARKLFALETAAEGRHI